MKRESIEPSSGNVFADLGLPDADELLAKSELAIEITQLLDKKGWTQAKIARRMDLDRPNVSDLLRGRLSGFSIDRVQAICSLVSDILESTDPYYNQRHGFVSSDANTQTH